MAKQDERSEEQKAEDRERMARVRGGASGGAIDKRRAAAAAAGAAMLVSVLVLVVSVAAHAEDEDEEDEDEDKPEQPEPEQEPEQPEPEQPEPEQPEPEQPEPEQPEPEQLPPVAATPRPCAGDAAEYKFSVVDGNAVKVTFDNGLFYALRESDMVAGDTDTDRFRNTLDKLVTLAYLIPPQGKSWSPAAHTQALVYARIAVADHPYNASRFSPIMNGPGILMLGKEYGGFGAQFADAKNGAHGKGTTRPVLFLPALCDLFSKYMGEGGGGEGGGGEGEGEGGGEGGGGEGGGYPPCPQFPSPSQQEIVSIGNELQAYMGSLAKPLWYGKSQNEKPYAWDPSRWQDWAFAGLLRLLQQHGLYNPETGPTGGWAGACVFSYTPAGDQQQALAEYIKGLFSEITGLPTDD